VNLIVSSNPVAYSTEDAPARWLLDALWVVLASGEGTNGEYSVIEQYMPVGSGPIPHIHRTRTRVYVSDCLLTQAVPRLEPDPAHQHKQRPTSQKCGRSPS
jgi:hypothetical protein